jgi:hypothetical protein
MQILGVLRLVMLLFLLFLIILLLFHGIVLLDNLLSFLQLNPLFLVVAGHVAKHLLSNLASYGLLLLNVELLLVFFVNLSNFVGLSFLYLGTGLLLLVFVFHLKGVV